MAIKPSGFLRLWMPASKYPPCDTCSKIPTISQSKTEVSFDVASEQKGYFWLFKRLLLPGCCWPDLHPTAAIPGQEHLGTFNSCCKQSPARVHPELQLAWGAPNMLQKQPLSHVPKHLQLVLWTRSTKARNFSMRNHRPGLFRQRTDNAGKIRSPWTSSLCKSSSDKECFAVSASTRIRICCQIRREHIEKQQWFFTHHGRKLGNLLQDLTEVHNL